MNQETLGGVLCASVPVAGIVLAAWLVVRWRRRRREAGPGKRVGPHRKTAPWAWVGLFTLVGLGALVTIITPRRGAPPPLLQPEPPRPAGYWLWVGIAGVLAALLAGGSVPFTELTRSGRRLRGLAIVAGCLTLFAIWRIFGPSYPFNRSIIGGMVLGFIAGFLWLKAYLRDREAERIVKQAEETGDLGRAVAELRAVIDAKGPSIPRLNWLGTLLMRKKAWDEAHRAFLDLEALVGREPFVLCNQAIALIEGGRAAEALPLLEEAMRNAPGNILLICQYGWALAELDRTAEAGEYLRRAERQWERSDGVYAKAEFDVLAELIAKLRRRVGEATGAEKKDLTGLDEF